ncbi:hypothetical protein A3A64_03145 [Candidatus Gottesmanbacteria bacterium RIFCSPLOWO2_01_FULL_48_11]|uniref:adenosylhomocysteine nucleosidase n=1 Tax=Candidatus Gottesmanbacteria bacterium RIFCSPLOWO2_01_FULL_48_11 TaxID=1798395 RepID=A0A1F6AUF8_9BACT|nr:MAG: hypothetical protein A3A64_03145 [Candidatus Gottesmanbacteria bacterium RIFCSPLOWO2_01_FULL_48_11]
MASTPILLLTAIPEEFIAIEKHLKISKRTLLWHQFSCIEGTLFGKKVVATITGLGKVSAAITSQQLISAYHPQAIILTGAAGGLAPDLSVGDVVVSRDCLQHDVDIRTFGFPRGTLAITMEESMIWRILKADERLRKLALSTKGTKHRIREGRILTGDQFFTTAHRTDFQYLTDELNGDAIDMEGAAVAQVCYANKVPFVIIRTISDKANDTATQDFSKVKTTITHNSLAVIKSILMSP